MKSALRTTLHVTTAVVCLLLVEHVLSPTGMIMTAGIGALCCWTLETGRIFSERLNGPDVLFGEEPAVNVQYVSPSELSVETPANAVIGSGGSSVLRGTKAPSVGLVD